MTSSYPFLAVKPWKPFPGRPFLPIHPSPDLVDYPPLPSSPRAQPFSTFSLSTHIIPAAHLRRGPRVPIPDLPAQVTTLSKEGVQLIEKLSVELTRSAKDLALRNNKHESILWNVLNRYVNNSLISSGSTGLTLFFVHAGGFPKEIWEPILARIFSSPAAAMISEVWTWESVQHGDAGLINAAALAGFFDWSDNSRDIFNFFLHFLPSIPLEKALPLHLAPISRKETKQRILHGFRNRKLILIGHSFGGSSLALGACHYPKLSSAIILVDPVMVRPGMPDHMLDVVRKWNSKGIKNILARKDTWESKGEAYTEFTSSPFYAAWDPEMLRIYIEYGLHNTTTIASTGITKCIAKTKLTPIHEALVNAGGDAPIEAFACLRDLDERIRLHWILSGAPGAPEFGPPGAQQERAWVRPKNSSNTRINRAGHLVPQECPKEFAQDIIQFLQKYYSSNNNIRASL